MGDIMKYSRKDLLQLPDRILHFDEKIVFDDETYKQFPRIRKLENVRAVGEGRYEADEQRLYLHLDVSGVLTCPCDITFEDVIIPFDSDADEIISFDKKDEDNIEILSVEGEYMELLPIIFRQILLEVPIKVRKEGKIDYPEGDGWRVMDEETYQREKEGRIDPRLAILKDYKPQDEEEV